MTGHSLADVLPRNRGIGGHHQPRDGRTHEWYTPPEIFEALGLTFDLDPCAPPLPAAPWIPAARRIALPEDGYTAEWGGRVWLNPPYGPHTARWLRRLAAHGDGIGLVFSRTDTAWFHDCLRGAHAVCFVRGRINFLSPEPRKAANRTDSNAGAPSMLVAYGRVNAVALARSGLGMTFELPAEALLGQGSLWE